MADPKDVQIHIDVTREELLAPVIAAQLTNAFYVAELLHAQKGTNPPREDVHHEVLKIWLEMTSKILNLSRQAKS